MLRKKERKNWLLLFFLAVRAGDIGPQLIAKPVDAFSGCETCCASAFPLLRFSKNENRELTEILKDIGMEFFDWVHDVNVDDVFFVSSLN